MHHEQSQDNKKSTPTSDIAPGAPIWYRSASGVHNNQDKGHGYSAHDPVPLTTGSSQRGSALTRFGKFGFVKQETTRTFDHGNVYDITIVREEGSQGTWTIKIKGGRRDTGVMGNLHSGVEHGYSVCRVDLDLYTLNQDLPGFELDQATGDLLLTFKPGEVKKVIKAVAPYRTTVRTLEPDVLRQAVTYHVAEWIPYHWAKYRVGPDNPMAWRNYGSPRYVGRVWNYCWYHTVTFPKWSTASDSTINPVSWRAWDFEQLSIDHSRQTAQDRWQWYNVLTLPMPRTWVEELQGNEIYIDNYDRNYKYRMQNNTCRDKHVPNRKDDTTLPDQKTDGWVTRYDHNNKMEAVVGQTRLTSMYMRSGNRMQRRSRYWNSYWCYYRWNHNYNHWHLFFNPFEQDTQFHFISNDRRITHRHTPEYPGATTHGVVYRPIVNTSGEEQWINSLSDQIAQPQYDVNLASTGSLEYHRNGYIVSYSYWNTLGEFLQDDHRNSPWNVAASRKSAGTLRANNTYELKQYPSWTTIAHPGLQGPYWYGQKEYYEPRRNNSNLSSGLLGKDQVPTAHALHDEWDWKTNVPGWYQMQTGYDVTDDVSDTGMTWRHLKRFKNSRNDLKHFDTTGAIPGRTPGELKYRQIPMNHTGWKREDFPGDPWFKYFKQNLDTFYPNDPAATNADGTDRVVEYYAWTYYSRETTAGYDFVKGTHPLTPRNMHDNDTRINWQSGIPAKWQSWYESTRYIPGKDNANDKHWALERADTLEPRMSKINIRSWTSQPSDKIFNYGDPTTGVGDLVQVMFNYTGMDRNKFLTGQSNAPGSSTVVKYNTYGWHAQPLLDKLNRSVCTEYFVMKYEDPSNIKDYYDGLGKNFELQHPNQTYLEYSNRYRTYHNAHRSSEVWIDDVLTNTNRFNNGGTDNRGYTNPQDWTDLWLTHDPLCAGKLDQLDVKNTDNNFQGYRWDNTTYDTTNGIESATRGLGSPGHGEQGTSRILYDFRDLVHPLSSYELNLKNLRGYYMSCVDHVDRQINLTIDYSSEEDLYALGQTTCVINLVHTPEYDPMLHEKYDQNIKGDSQIRPGPTFSSNQSWDDKPNNKSVTERLFTIDGALATNPVAFLGLSAGVYAGGDPENPVDELPPAPGLLRINPITSRVINTIENSTTRDWSSEPLHVVKQFSNQGSGTLVLTLPYTLGEEYGYTRTDGTTTGDDATVWSWEYHDTSTPETSYSFPSRPSKNRPGPDGLYNTVSLSADEKIAIRYTLQGRSSFWSRYDDGDPTCKELYTESAGYEYAPVEIDPEADEVDQPATPVLRMVVPPAGSALRDNLKITTNAEGEEVVTHTKCPAKYNTVNHDIVVTNTDGSETLRQQTFVTKYLD